MIKSIGEISNYYGGLNTQELDGRYFWWIEEWNGLEETEEIPKYLYDALIRFENERKESKIVKGEE
jgi:hypothetical protein